MEESLNLVQAAATPLLLSQDGSVNVAVINAALASVGTVYLPAGTYPLEGTILMPSNSHLTARHGECILRAVNNNQRYMLANAGVSWVNGVGRGIDYAATTANTNIQITGDIVFNNNAVDKNNNGSANPNPSTPLDAGGRHYKVRWVGHALLFLKVSNWRIIGIVVGATPKYCIAVGGCSDFDVDVKWFENSSDGLHILGDCHRFRATLRGATADDMFSTTTADYLTYDMVSGDITDYQVHVWQYGCGPAGLMGADAQPNPTGVVRRNIQGYIKADGNLTASMTTPLRPQWFPDAWLNCNAVGGTQPIVRSGAKSGWIDELTIEPEGRAQQSGITQNSLVHLNMDGDLTSAQFGRVRINNARSVGGSSTSTGRQIFVGENTIFTKGLIINGINVEDGPANQSGNGVIYINQNVVLPELIVRNASVNFRDGTGAYFLVLQSTSTKPTTVGEITIDGYRDSYIRRDQRSIKIKGSTGGNIRIGDGTNETANIAHNATASTVASALNAMTGIGGTISATGGPLSTADVVITSTATLPALRITTSTLTGAVETDPVAQINDVFNRPYGNSILFDNGGYLTACNLKIINVDGSGSDVGGSRRRCFVWLSTPNLTATTVGSTFDTVDSVLRCRRVNTQYGNIVWNAGPGTLISNAYNILGKDGSWAGATARATGSISLDPSTLTAPVRGDTVINSNGSSSATILDPAGATIASNKQGPIVHDGTNWRRLYA